MADLIDEVLAILQEAGVQAEHGLFRWGLIVIPVNPELTLHAGATRNYGWKIELWANAGYPGEAIEVPEPVPASDSVDAEAIAVFILRSLFRAGAKNPQQFPALPKTQSHVSGL